MNKWTPTVSRKGCFQGWTKQPLVKMNLVNEGDYQPKNPVTLVFNVGIYVSHFEPLPPIFSSWNWVCDSQLSISNYLCVNYYHLTLHVVSQVLTHNTSQSLPIVAQKIASSRIFSSKYAYYKSFSEYLNFSWPKSDTPFIEPVLLGPYLSFVPNLPSLGGIPTTG